MELSTKLKKKSLYGCVSEAKKKKFLNQKKRINAANLVVYLPICITRSEVFLLLTYIHTNDLFLQHKGGKGGSISINNSMTLDY